MGKNIITTLTSIRPKLVFFACVFAYAAAQVGAMESHYQNLNDLPHWLTEAEREYIHKQSYRPALTKQQFKEGVKEAEKRQSVRNFLENPVGQAFTLVGTAIANDDFEKTYKFQPQNTVDTLQSHVEPAFSVRMDNMTGVEDDPELTATYGAKNPETQKHWGFEAKANPDDTSIRFKWGFGF